MLAKSTGVKSMYLPVRRLRLFLAYLSGVVAFLGLSAAEAGDVLTQHYNNARTGATLEESVLNTTNVASGIFQKLWTLYADGQIVAQPLYVSDLQIDTTANPAAPPVKGKFNAVIIATMHNTVYVYDAEKENRGPDGRTVPLWATWLGQPRAGGKDIVVGELGFRIHLEVLIADIASADERHRVVDDQQFIVHSIVEPWGVEQELAVPPQPAMTAIRERIEDSDLDCRMAVQRDDLLIASDGVPIIDQHAHAHTAIGRPQQSFGQQSTSLVAAKNEILQIQGPFRGIDHLYPGQEPVDPDRYDAKSRRSVMCL